MGAVPVLDLDLGDDDDVPAALSLSLVGVRESTEVIVMLSCGVEGRLEV